MRVLLVSAILCCFAFSDCNPITYVFNAIKYLQIFGYLDENIKCISESPSGINENTVVAAVAKYQKSEGLNPTGVLDEKTMDEMSLPRCVEKGMRFITYHIPIRPQERKSSRKKAEDDSIGAPTPHSDGPDLCQNTTIDAITKTQSGDTYVFKGDFYWKIVVKGDQNRIATGYPRRIKEDWGGLEGNLDASLTTTDGKTLFFKDSRYWRFTNRFMDPGFPRLINSSFGGIPDKLDAALVWNGNGKTYFFKGNLYWRYDSKNNPPVSDRYPKPISRWGGIPNDIDAAFQSLKNHLYFFKGDLFYKLNERRLSVDAGDPGLSRSFPKTSLWWFSCPMAW